MDNETKLPMDWVPLREAAERLARETWAANVRRFEENGWSTVELHGGDEYAMEGLRLFSLAQADLLADLRRPASRDWAARLLAEKVGLTVGATAPEWRQTSSGWWILYVDPSRCETGGNWFFAEFQPMGHRELTVVPGISTLTDPAAALRAALLAVVPHV